MATLPEPDNFPAGIYQLEDTDPVKGGAPNEATGDGMDNIPHAQLARRTRWLKTRVDSLLTSVSSLTGTIASMVPSSRTIGAGGLATGGGQLNGDRTITVTDATQAEAEAGAASNRAMSPLRVAQSVAARLLGYGMPTAVGAADLNALDASGFGAGTTPSNRPFDYPAVVTIKRTEGRSAQIALPSNDPTPRIAARSKGPTGNYGAWREAWLGAPAAQSLAPTGYQVLPSGLIIQWGAAITASDGFAHVVFPIPFPTASRSISLTDRSSGLISQTHVFSISADSATGFSACSMRLDTQALGTSNFHWMAFGY